MEGNASKNLISIRKAPPWTIVCIAIFISLLVNIAMLWNAGRVGYPLWITRFGSCLAGAFVSALILTLFRFSRRQFLKWYAIWGLAILLQALAGEAATSVYISGFKHSLLSAAPLSKWQELAKSVDHLRIRESEIGDSKSSPVYDHGTGYNVFFQKKAAELPGFVSTIFGRTGVTIWSVAAVSSPRSGIFVTWNSGSNVALIIYPTRPGGGESETALSIRAVDGINRANPNEVLHRQLLCDGVEIIIFGDAS